jgi:hypothetical protein
MLHHTLVSLVHNRALLAIAALSAGIATVAVAVPAIGAPEKVAPARATATSPAKVAKQALTLAKAADKRSKQALAAAKVKTAGPAGASGTPGAPGTNGRNGIDGNNGVGQPGAAGSTLKPQLTTADFNTETTLTPTQHPVAFTQAADRGNLVAAGVTVTPPASATCTGGTPGMQVDVYLDSVDTAHQLLTAQFPAAGSPSPTTLSSKPGYLVRGGASSGHNLIVTGADNCTGGGHGSVSNVKVDIVDFAP